MSQKVVVERLLPIRALNIEPLAGVRAKSEIDYRTSRRPERVFDDAHPAPCRSAGLPRAARVERRVLLRGADDGDGFRSRNASEMIDQLTLYMNKVRQAAITREIIEVVSGAGAL